MQWQILLWTFIYNKSVREKSIFSLIWLVWLCWPWIMRSNYGISHFSGIFPLAQGGFNPPLLGSWSSRLPWLREGFYGQCNPKTIQQLWFNTTDARNSADLIFGLTGGYLWQWHCIQDQPAFPGSFWIDPRLDVTVLRVPVASREDYRSQAILKFHCSSSLDYRARHKLPVKDLRCEKFTIRWCQHHASHWQKNVITWNYFSKYICKY